MVQTIQAACTPLETFDWAAYESSGIAIVTSVAKQAALDPGEMEPLQSVIAVDALNALLQPSHTGQSTTGSFQFEYLGYSILLDTGGQGFLYESPRPSVANTGRTHQSVSADQT